MIGFNWESKAEAPKVDATEFEAKANKRDPVQDIELKLKDVAPTIPKTEKIFQYFNSSRKLLTQLALLQAAKT